MPPEGLDWLPSPALLTDGELARLIGIAVQQLGIAEVRFTGGEPLLRRGLPGIVARTAALRPRRKSPSPPTESGSPGWPGHCAKPGLTGSTYPWTPCHPRLSPRLPGGTGCPTSWPVCPPRPPPG
jgi:cyclic pyranopterin phosphate synthase